MGVSNHVSTLMSEREVNMEDSVRSFLKSSGKGTVMTSAAESTLKEAAKTPKPLKLQS